MAEAVPMAMAVHRSAWPKRLPRNGAVETVEAGQLKVVKVLQLKQSKRFEPAQLKQSKLSS